MTAHADGVDTVAWLLESDPAIRWQAMRDLTAASPAAIAAERARVPREGLGAEILARQESDGSWRRSDAPVWSSTLFTFLLLRATGSGTPMSSLTHGSVMPCNSSRAEGKPAADGSSNAPTTRRSLFRSANW